MACHLHLQPSRLASATGTKPAAFDARAPLQSHYLPNSLSLVAPRCGSAVHECHSVVVVARASAVKRHAYHSPPRLSSRREGKSSRLPRVGCSGRIASSDARPSFAKRGAVRVRAQGPTTAAAAAAGAGAAGASDFSEFAAAIPQPAPPEAEKKQPISDLVWPAVGAFVSFAGFALADHLLQSHGLTVSLGSFGAVCCLLFAAPQAAVSQRKTILIAHVGTALIGVALFCLLGPSWLAKATAVAASIAFMQFTNSVHPPAAGLPLIFLDAPKFHRLKWWYPLFPGLVGCLWLFLVQEGILFLKEKVKF